MQRLHPDDRDRIRQAFANAENTGHYEGEYRILLPNDRMRWIASRGRVEFSNGRPVLIRGASLDITMRRRAEESAKTLSGRLIHAQEAERTRLARELHDDLNQSLAVLAIELDVLGQNPPATGSEVSARMRDLSAHVKDLSSSVHRLSHELHPAKLEQLGLVAAARGLCRELGAARNIAIEFESHAVPRVVPDEIALCLYRIVQEGLQNVIKHSGSATAKVELISNENQLRLIVSDQGCGFDSTAATQNGSLGLVSMRERVRLVGGRISIDSRKGEGTRIRGTDSPGRKARDCRLAACRRVDFRAISGCRIKTTSARMNHRPRIVLADDHTMLLEAFRRLLEPQCEIVGTACDGRALIELALKTNPEIIVLDISMPRLNGMDACAQLRHKLPGVKFVFLTVNEDADLAAEAIRLGASAFLLKSSASAELTLGH